jgi:hypothetical protein
MKGTSHASSTKCDGTKHLYISVVSMLKARDVWDEQEARKEQRMAAMRPVLAQLYAKIRRQAIHSPTAPYVVFEIPSYVFGYPLFQLTEARDYLLHVLQTSGYLVWVVDEKYLFVSWMKTTSRGSNYRPPLVTNYRPQVYGEGALGNMLR